MHTREEKLKAFGRMLDVLEKHILKEADKHRNVDESTESEPHQRYD